MDSRTFASFTAKNSYEYHAKNGVSATCPWLAGLYALCLQVNPELSYEDFINLAFETGASLNLENGSSLQTVVQPENLINAIKNK